MKKTCNVCSAEFSVPPSRSGRKYCSHQCYVSDQKDRLIERCRNRMGTTFESRSASAKRRYSDKTKHPMYGRKHTETTRRKQSEVKKGLLVGARNGMFGKKHSVAACEKISDATAKRIMNGEYRWKSGTVTSIKMKVDMTFRSSWEEKFISYLDSRDDVVDFFSESIRIRYYDSKRKPRWYIPDFFIRYADGRKEIVELKPECFVDYDINKRKAAAAREFCRKEGEGLKYRILTQKYLKRIGVL